MISVLLIFFSLLFFSQKSPFAIYAIPQAKSTTRIVGENVFKERLLGDFSLSPIHSKSFSDYSLQQNSLVNRSFWNAYSKSLASTVVESALHQQFLKQHLKTITNFSENDCSSAFFIDLVKKSPLQYQRATYAR